MTLAYLVRWQNGTLTVHHWLAMLIILLLIIEAVRGEL